MRYLAILKDSLREARDSWVLLGLLVLCTLMIFFVVSLSFEPVSAERTMRLFFSKRGHAPEMYVALNNRKPEKVALLQILGRPLELEKVELLRGTPDAPESDYALTVKAVTMDFGEHNPFGPHKGQPIEKKKRNPEKDREIELAQLRLMFEDAEAAGFIKVGGIESLAKKDETDPQRYRVTVLGTPTTHRVWATETSFAFGFASLSWILDDMPLAFRLYGVAKFFIGTGSWIAVLMGIVVTAFFIPSMLRKGTIDLLLVKPISRPLLLFYKYLGGMTFMFLVTAYAIGGIWFALGIRSGFWANGALLLIFTLTFFFAILYAISTLVGVVTRSIIMSILVTVFAYGMLASIGYLYSLVVVAERMITEIEKAKEVGEKGGPMGDKDIPGWLQTVMTTIKVVHHLSPRTDDLNSINDLIIYSEFMTGSLRNMGKLDSGDRNWWLSILVSATWIAIFLCLSSAWFYFKDY